ncbi:hypothetical protein L7F22_054096 [Adiantum nelumboides]|nr:hypothetical protein [Adiantum nelumboides]
MKDDIGADVKKSVAENSNIQSQVLSGPRGSLASSHVANPWSGRLRTYASPASSINVSRKGNKKVDEGMRMPNVSAEHDDVNGHSSGSEHSLSEELGIPSVRTLGVKRLHAQNRALGKNVESSRLERNRYPVDILTYDGYVAKHFASMAKIAQNVELTCFEEAAENVKWQEAMDEEMDALYKARLVAKGYAQTYGIDYEETFSPVAKMATVRAVTAVAAAKGWILYQMDVKNAFLHGDLQEEVYMVQPPGFQETGHPDYVYKLQKALYGLKQGPRAWHDKIAQYLITIGFHMADADHSLFVQKTEAEIVTITIYVDDLIIGGDALKDVEHVKALLRKQFDMKDLGELRYFLGIEMIHNEGVIWLSQKKYGLDMLIKYGMADCKPISTSLDQNLLT